MSEQTEFREEVAAWLKENCPDAARGPGSIANGSSKITLAPELAKWLERMAEKGWTVPTWPTEYGGGGLSPTDAHVLYDEMGKIHARSPLMGMGTSMIGPTLLEYGTEEQKRRHVPKIARGEVQWCQGYSEPDAGSDLGGLGCAATLDGDEWIINGQKICFQQKKKMACFFKCTSRTLKFSASMIKSWPSCLVNQPQIEFPNLFFFHLLHQRF